MIINDYICLSTWKKLPKRHIMSMITSTNYETFNHSEIRKEALIQGFGGIKPSEAAVHKCS